MMTPLSENNRYFICWRIEGELCGRSLNSMAPSVIADLLDKTVAVWGKANVWLELDI